MGSMSSIIFGVFSRTTRRGYRGYRSATAALMALITILVMSLLVGGAGAQSLNETYYGYFEDDGTPVGMIADLQINDVGAAGQVVSPTYADDFFFGFGGFTDYDFADLTRAEQRQLEGADEYMVFDGTLDGFNGIDDGMVIFVSAGGDVFIVIGYEDQRSALLDLAEAAIDSGRAPLSVGDYIRVEL